MKQRKFTQVLKTVLLASFIGLIGQSASGQTNFGSIGTAVSQNFDGLTQDVTNYTLWSDNSTLSGWYAATDANASLTQIKGNVGGNTTASLYSFGSAGASDRALGFFPSDAFTGAGGNSKGYLGWRLHNNTGKNIGTIRVTWTGEQWRKATDNNIQYIRLSYLVGSQVTALASGAYITTDSYFASPIHSAVGTNVLNGNLAANRTVGITIEINVKIPAGQEIMLRWEDANDPANHTLAIDDVSFTAIKEAQSITFGALATKTYGDAPFALTATASSGLTVSYTTSNTSVATISGSTLTIAGAGTSNIKAIQTGNSSFAPADTVAQLLTVKPQAPVAVSATNVTTQGFTAHWNAASGATSYYLYVSTDPTFTTKTTSALGNVLSFDILTGLEPGTTYYYKLCSFNTGIYSDYSNVIPVTTNPGIQTFNITASPTFTTATLNWSNGNLESRAVFMKEGTGAITLPSDMYRYTDSQDWSNPGEELGSSGYFCVYYGTGSSVDLTNLYPGRTYTVQAFEFDGAEWSENYLTTVTGANNPITFVPWPTTTWTNTNGVSSPEAWSTAARWDHNIVPTAALHPAVLVYIDGNCEVTNAAECNNLTIKAAHASITPKLSINTNQSLNVVDLLTNSGTSSSLIVRSAAGVPTGSLTFGSGSPTGSVEMYSKASWNLANPSGSKYSWQFFGIPVKTLTAGNTFSGLLGNDAGSTSFIRQWDESSVNFLDAWVVGGSSQSLYKTSASTLDQNHGYELVQQNPKIYTFAGSLLNSDYTQTLSKTNGAYFGGQHIFGNPYTAAVDIEAIQFDGNTEKAIYQYNTGTYHEWETSHGETSPSYSLAITPGQYSVSTPSTAGTLGLLREIPSMQGFLVKAITNSGQITIPRTALIKNNAVQRVKSLTSNKIATRIDLVGTHFTDCMWIFTSPECTRNFDNGWDGRKLPGVSGVSQLYSIENDGNYQINAVNDMNESYLGLQPGNDTQFKLVFNHENASTQYGTIYLVDLVANKTIDVTQSGTEYSFTSTANDVTKRFKIVTQTTGTTPIENDSKLKMFNSGDLIYVQNLTNSTADYVLYNVSGKIVQHFTVNANSVKSINSADLKAGVYIAKSETETEKATQRFIIR
ncbi:MAG: T9SS type A sorting domain-containing protein [Paludibacter sp.]